MTKKKPLSKEGQVGLVLLVLGLVICVATAELLGLAGLFCGIAGFYILTNQDKVRVPSLQLKGRSR